MMPKSTQANPVSMQHTMLTYEAYLDEVCTLLFELFELTEADAVRMIMKAQDDGFFIPHDQDDAMRQLSKAVGDADTIFMRYRG
jgi:hypothetical protein